MSGSKYPFNENSAAATIDYKYSIRLYRQFDTNLNEINNLWKDGEFSINKLLKDGFKSNNDAMRNAILEGLRKSAAASALLASAISQYIINLGDKGSPKILEEDINEDYTVKYPIRSDSLPSSHVGALFGGKKKTVKKDPSKKKPIKKLVKKDSPKKKPVKKETPKKKSLKKLPKKTAKK